MGAFGPHKPMSWALVKEKAPGSECFVLLPLFLLRIRKQRCHWNEYPRESSEGRGSWAHSFRSSGEGPAGSTVQSLRLSVMAARTRSLEGLLTSWWPGSRDRQEGAEAAHTPGICSLQLGITQLSLRRQSKHLFPRGRAQTEEMIPSRSNLVNQ